MDHGTLITMEWCFTVTLRLIVLILLAHQWYITSIDDFSLYYYNATVFDFFLFFFKGMRVVVGWGEFFFKPWKSFPAANNGGPMTVKESDQ